MGTEIIPDKGESPNLSTGYPLMTRWTRMWARFRETLRISPPNSAGAEVPRLRKWHVGCLLVSPRRGGPAGSAGEAVRGSGAAAQGARDTGALQAVVWEVGISSEQMVWQCRARGLARRAASHVAYPGPAASRLRPAGSLSRLVRPPPSRRRARRRARPRAGRLEPRSTGPAGVLWAGRLAAWPVLGGLCLAGPWGRRLGRAGGPRRGALRSPAALRGLGRPVPQAATQNGVLLGILGLDGLRGRGAEAPENPVIARASVDVAAIVCTFLQAGRCGRPGLRNRRGRPWCGQLRWPVCNDRRG